jgi:hypothetical protein
MSMKATPSRAPESSHSSTIRFSLSSAGSKSTASVLDWAALGILVAFDALLTFRGGFLVISFFSGEPSLIVRARNAERVRFRTLESPGLEDVKELCSVVGVAICVGDCGVMMVARKSRAVLTVSKIRHERFS